MKCPKRGYHSETRSEEQNRLLWAGAYGPIAQVLSEESGKVITKEMVHEVSKDRFCPRIIVEFQGKSKSYPKSTTRLNKQEFSDYLEQVYAWGAELGAVFA